MNTQLNPLDPNMVVSIADPNAPSTKQKVPPSCLPNRQLQVLRGIALGENTKSIAIALKVSPKTVEYHRMQLMIKLNLFSVPELIHYALATRLVAPMFDVTFTEVVKTEVTIDIGQPSTNKDWTALPKRVVPLPKKKRVFVKKRYQWTGNPAMEKYASVFGTP